jgi:hypothetical protein
VGGKKISSSTGGAGTFSGGGRGGLGRRGGDAGAAGAAAVARADAFGRGGGFFGVGRGMFAVTSRAMSHSSQDRTVPGLNVSHAWQRHVGTGGAAAEASSFTASPHTWHRLRLVSLNVWQA